MRDAMTAIDDAITSEGTPLVSRGRRTWPRVAIAFVVGFVLCLLIAGGALLAHDASLDGRVLPGVSVGGVDLSGLDRAGATTALTGAFGHLAEGRVVVRTTAGDVAIPFADFGASRRDRCHGRRGAPDGPVRDARRARRCRGASGDERRFDGAALLVRQGGPRGEDQLRPSLRRTAHRWTAP